MPVPTGDNLTAVNVRLLWVAAEEVGWHAGIIRAEEYHFTAHGRVWGRYGRWYVHRIEANRAKPDFNYRPERLIASLRAAISAQLDGRELSGLSRDKIAWKEKR